MGDHAAAQVDRRVVDVREVVAGGARAPRGLLGEEEDVSALVLVIRVEPQVAVSVEPARESMGLPQLRAGGLAEIDP